MSELNFKPLEGSSLAGDKTVAVPALNAGASGASASRQSSSSRLQRRRMNATRLQFEESGFKLFRIY